MSTFQIFVLKLFKNAKQVIEYNANYEMRTID